MHVLHLAEPVYFQPKQVRIVPTLISSSPKANTMMLQSSQSALAKPASPPPPDQHCVLTSGSLQGHQVTQGTSTSPSSKHPMVTASSPKITSHPENQPLQMMKDGQLLTLSLMKRKKYLLTLEARLQMTQHENQRLRSENGSMRAEMAGLMSENADLRKMVPKRRGVCLLVVLVVVVFNIGPVRWAGDSSFRQPGDTVWNSRHLLGFTPFDLSAADQGTPDGIQSPSVDSWEDFSLKEQTLMVVKKEPLVFGLPPPCQPVFSRIKFIRLTNSLRGWVSRHETQTGSNTSDQHQPEPVMNDPEKKAPLTQSTAIQSSDRASGSQVQVYNAYQHSFQDLLIELNRREDTFYIVSFHRDHILLSATSHNRGSRPKMSLVYPDMTANETVIKDKAYQVMMQIDVEVTDIKYVHIKTSSIPHFLHNNDTEHRSTPSSSNQDSLSADVLLEPN